MQACFDGFMVRQQLIRFTRFISQVVFLPVLHLCFRTLDFLRGGAAGEVSFLLKKEKSIYLARQQRALESTVEYIENNLPHVQSVGRRLELLTKAFGQADVSGDRLICEFGVFNGSSINHTARLTKNTVFGFDSFQGLPEDWGGDQKKKGTFRVSKIPRVEKNVILVKGWFNETIPPFLNQHAGKIGFLHVDCDLYSSTKIIFDSLGSRLQAGSVIVFDDYFNYPRWEEGEAKAFKEFLLRTGLSAEFISYNRNGEQLAVILR
jgi:hypothetical protein